MASTNSRLAASSDDGVNRSEAIMSRSELPEAPMATKPTKMRTILIISRAQDIGSLRTEKRPYDNQETSEGASLATPAVTPVVHGDSIEVAPSSSSPSPTSSGSTASLNAASTGSSPAEHTTPDEQAIGDPEATVEARGTKRKRSSDQSPTARSKRHRWSPDSDVANDGSNDDDPFESIASGSGISDLAVSSVPSLKLDDGQQTQTAGDIHSQVSANSTNMKKAGGSGDQALCRRSTRERKPVVRYEG